MRKAALLLVLPLGLFGCGKGNFSQRSAAANAKSGVFRYPIVTKPTTMDPGKVQDGDTIDVIQQVYEGLVGWGTDNQVAPKLAERWDVTDGGRTYVFHLRKGVRFSDGREVTAQDFKDCIERNCDPRLASETVADYMTNIVGVSDVIAGKAKGVSGIKAIDPQTLSVTIDKPRPYFLGKLTYPCAFVFDLKKVKDPTKEITTMDEMVGTGGFRFTAVNPDTEIDMASNAGYWDGKPPLDEIRRPYIADASTRLNAYKSGDLDLVQLERADVVGIKADPQFGSQIHLFDRPATWYIGLNCEQYAPLKNPKVRLALAMAIDKDKIVERDARRHQREGRRDRPARGVRPSGQGRRGAVRSGGSAKKLLAEAGLPGRAGLPQDGDVVPQQPPRHPARRGGGRRAVATEPGSRDELPRPGVGRLPGGEQQEDPSAVPHALGGGLPRRGELPEHPARELRQREQGQLREPDVRRAVPQGRHLAGPGGAEAALRPGGGHRASRGADDPDLLPTRRGTDPTDGEGDARIALRPSAAHEGDRPAKPPSKPQAHDDPRSSTARSAATRQRATASAARRDGSATAARLAGHPARAMPFSFELPLPEDAILRRSAPRRDLRALRGRRTTRLRARSARSSPWSEKARPSSGWS